MQAERCETGYEVRSESITVDRRTFVGGLSVAGMIGLAGCVGDDDDDGDEYVTPTLDVETGEATDIGERTATLTGEVVTLEGLDEAAISFEYGEADGDLDSTVEGETVSEPGDFEVAVEELIPDTAYEFRAVAEAEDLVAEGAVEQFSTAEAEPNYTVVVEGTSFTPDELTISVGETVEWVFEGGGHNIFITEAPEESDWEGTEGFDRYPQGHHHQHTFLVPGTYEYYCQPHSHLDMEGTIVVEG